MNKVLLFVSASFLSLTAFAGVGGYQSETCISKSGRTVYTFLAKDAAPYNEVNLLIDGSSLKLEDGVDGVSIDSGEDVQTITKNGKRILTITTTKFNSAGITEAARIDVAPGADPRLTRAGIEHQAKPEGFSAQVDCKSFEQNP